jgi:ribosomal protein L12E/L44/L45/RPP1/RPP2
MTIRVQLNADEEIALKKKAQAAGIDVAAYALRVLRSEANRPSLDELLAPVRAGFAQSGLTDDQVAEQYEGEKHAQRAAHRGKPFDE